MTSPILALPRLRGSMPEPLRFALRIDPTRDQWASFTAAIAYADAGFRVLPCEPGAKSPLAWGAFRHGARTASRDRETVRDAFVDNPGANVGIVPDPSYVILDIDPRTGGTLERAEGFGLPIDGYRERSGGGGWHLPLTMPVGVAAERSTTLAPGIELKGSAAYAVSPHSRLDGAGWYRVDPDRDVWQWGAIPAGWPFLDRLARRQTTKIITASPTEQHFRRARRVLHVLGHGKYAQNVRLLIAGAWRDVQNDDGTQRYPSQSEADLGLAAMCVFGAAGDPHVMDAAMRSTKLFRAKWDTPHDSSGATYGQITISRAIASSPWANRGSSDPPHSASDAGDAIRDRIDAGRELLAGPFPDSPVPTVFMMGHFVSGGVKNRVASALLAFLAGVREAGPDSPFRRPQNWIRVPVSGLARALDVDRKTVARALGNLDQAGIVERRTVVTRVNGSARKDSLARLRTTEAA